MMIVSNDTQMQMFDFNSMVDQFIKYAGKQFDEVDEVLGAFQDFIQTKFEDQKISKQISDLKDKLIKDDLPSLTASDKNLILKLLRDYE